MQRLVEMVLMSGRFPTGWYTSGGAKFRGIAAWSQTPFPSRVVSSFCSVVAGALDHYERSGFRVLTFSGEVE